MLAGLLKYGIINILVSIGLIGFVLGMNRIKRGVVLYRTVSLLFWFLLFYWVYTAPMNGYASIWAILYPILVFFLLGKREGFVWSASMAVMCAIIFFNPFNIPGMYHYSNQFAGRHLGTLLFVFFLTYYYESVRVEYKEALDQDRSELKLHRDNLEILVADRTDEIQRKNVELKSALEQLKETTAQYLNSQLEKEKVQEQLAHSQKMEAVGTLVGGLAHDFNNLLGGIIGSFNLLEIILEKESLERREEIREYLDVGIESSKKSSNIIRQLLTFSRKQEIALGPMDINNTLRNILPICKNSFSKNIILDFRITDMLIPVMADPVCIEQVLLNLCINGAHSMTIMRGDHERRGGRLTVIPEIMVTDESLVRNEPESFKADSWARIRVIDTGVGIPEENLDRIFEPFYSTKKNEGGSGLGLAISYGIIQQHGGFMSVESTRNEGSVFSLYLPLAEAVVPTIHKIPALTEMNAVAGSGTVLVVDDEAYMLDVVSGFLEEFGWEALTAATPEKAISIFKEKHNDISAVLIDFSMPGKSGIELFREFAAIDPQVKAVLCSGLVENEVRGSAFSAGMKKILHKPFVAEDLITVLNDLVWGKRSVR